MEEFGRNAEKRVKETEPGQTQNTQYQYFISFNQSLFPNHTMSLFIDSKDN